MIWLPRTGVMNRQSGWFVDDYELVRRVDDLHGFACHHGFMNVHVVVQQVSRCKESAEEMERLMSTVHHTISHMCMDA